MCLYCTAMHAAIIVDFVVISYFIFYKKSELGARPLIVATNAGRK